MRAGGRSRPGTGAASLHGAYSGAQARLGHEALPSLWASLGCGSGPPPGPPGVGSSPGRRRLPRPVSRGAGRWGADPGRGVSCPCSWTPRLISVRGPAFVPGHMMAGGVPHGRYKRGRSFSSGRPAIAGGSYSREQAARIIRTGAPTGRAWAHAAWNASSPSSLKMWWAWRASLRATDNVARLAPSRAATSL
jgi:hypothetical protein